MEEGKRDAVYFMHSDIYIYILLVILAHNFVSFLAHFTMVLCNANYSSWKKERIIVKKKKKKSKYYAWSWLPG